MTLTNSLPDIFYPQRPRMEGYLSLVAYCFLLFLVVDVNPFPEQFEGDLHIDFEGTGDLLRQGILAGLFVLILPTIPKRLPQIVTLLKSNFLLLAIFTWCALSPIWALAPDICMRRVLGMIVSFIITLTIATLRPASLIKVFIWVTGTYMVADLVGVFVLPAVRTIHSDGSWRGLHNQKNPAGAASAVAAFIWLQAGLARRSRILLAGSALWVFFLFKTVSKTSIALFFIILPYQYFFGRIIRDGHCRSRTAILLILLLIVVPVGALILYWTMPELFIDLTFTGRTYIWDFVWRKIQQAPLLGYGYNSFWSVGPITPALNEADILRVARYAEAHNGYLEVLVMVGVIGFVPTLIYVLRPFLTLFSHDYTRFSNDDQTAQQLFYTLALFSVAHNTMESDYLQGLSFIWIISLISILLISVSTVRSRQYSNVTARRRVAHAH